jgi:TIR domain
VLGWQAASAKLLSVILGVYILGAAGQRGRLCLLAELAMADIFISYSKQDRVPALKLAAWLETQGWTTWQDRTGVADDIRDENLKELRKARVVIVLWSAASVRSAHILHEAIAARDANKLVHVKVSGLALQRIPVSLGSRVVLDADDLPSIGRAISSVPKDRPIPLKVRLAEARDFAVEAPSTIAPLPDVRAAEKPGPGLLAERAQLRRSDDDRGVLFSSAGPPRDRKRELVVTKRTRETGREASEHRESLRLARQKRTALLATGSACLAALTIAVVFRDGLLDALSSALNGMTKLLAVLK